MCFASSVGRLAMTLSWAFRYALSLSGVSIVTSPRVGSWLWRTDIPPQWPPPPRLLLIANASSNARSRHALAERAPAPAHG
jgi:hypothetical protein